MSPYKGSVDGQNDDTVTANEGRSESPQSETLKACLLDVKDCLAVCCSLDAKVSYFSVVGTRVPLIVSTVVQYFTFVGVHHQLEIVAEVANNIQGVLNKVKIFGNTTNLHVVDD